MKVAQQTINMIHGQLGPARDHQEGVEVNGRIQGQRVETIEGGERYIPTAFNYTARVVLRNDRLEWDIIAVNPIR